MRCEFDPILYNKVTPHIPFTVSGWDPYLPSGSPRIISANVFAYSQSLFRQTSGEQKKERMNSLKKEEAPPLSTPDSHLHGPLAESLPSMECDDLTALGYKPELRRNRSMLTLLFQSLAIAAVCTIIALY